MTFVYRLGKGIFFVWFRLLNHLVIKGKENLSSDKPMIVFANHCSNMDPLVLSQVISEQVYFMAKAELFRIPVIKSVVRGYGAFPVDRGNADLAAIKTALKTLKENKILGIFPEGTRVREIEKSDPKGGFSMIAMKTGAVLQPIHIQYKRKFIFFNRIEIVIGHPIPSSELKLTEKSPDEYTRVSRELMKGVYDLS